MSQHRQQQPKKPALDLDALPDEYFQYVLRLRTESQRYRHRAREAEAEAAELKATIKALTATAVGGDK